MAYKKMMIQQLSDLVEWFLSDRQVELRFDPIVNGERGGSYPGKVAPEFNFIYLMDGRKITDKALAMLIMMELARRNYGFNLARIIAALMEHSRRYYVANQEYPDRLNKPVTTLTRPVGRPRTKLKKIPFPHTIDPLDRSDRGLPELVNTGEQEPQLDV